MISLPIGVTLDCNERDVLTNKHELQRALKSVNIPVCICNVKHDVPRPDKSQSHAFDSVPPPVRKVFLTALKEFDSTKGYPGEGPPRTRSAPPRPQRDLGDTMHAPATIQERSRALSFF